MLHKRIKLKLETLIGQASSSPLHPYEGFARTIETLVQIAEDQAKLFPQDFRWKIYAEGLKSTQEIISSGGDFQAIDYHDQRSDEQLKRDILERGL